MKTAVFFRTDYVNLMSIPNMDSRNQIGLMVQKFDINLRDAVTYQLPLVWSYGMDGWLQT